MGKYLIASDFDSTLCHWPEGRVYDCDRAAIRRFRESGNKFVVVTGRTYRNSRWGFESTGFFDMDACFCLSGALCTSPDGEVIYDKRADAAGLREIIDYFKMTNARYLSYDIGKVSGCIDIGGEPVAGLPMISPDEALKFESFTSLNAGYNDFDTAKARVSEIAALFGDIVTPLQNAVAIDMPPAGINKATAAGFAAEMYGISEDNIYTVGDNLNDISMISAYHGSAMDFCPEELAAVAERKIHCISEIIEFIEAEQP